MKKGGVLEHLTHEVQVEALVTDLPHEIEVDISDLDMGERIRVEDLPELLGRALSRRRGRSPRRGGPAVGS